VYYAGWSDKFQQVFSSVNPVATSHFNFSVPEPMGIVAVMAPDDPSLLSLASIISAVIVGGNTTIILASETKPLTAITLSEILSTSDLPAGVVNILTGFRDELIPHFASHMDVNAFWFATANQNDSKKIQELAAENVKRVCFMTFGTWREDEAESPYVIEPFLETKTTWHPVGY
jgi:acyl-CoA reductase-like NAD-dependent aldehyde dehydrogenase